MIKSAVTAKFQTTLPSGARKTLGLHPGDKLAYRVKGNRGILMQTDTEARQPVINAFLNFLERDMLTRSEGLKPIPAELFEQAAALTEGIEVDLDAAIEGEVAI